MQDLTAERVRRDVEVLARAGLDLPVFLEEVHASLQRAIPHAGACANTVDPATQLATMAVKLGEIEGEHDHDGEWCLIEYGDPEPTAFRALSEAGQRAEAVSSATGGDLRRSRRYRDYLAPYFDWTDELRIVAADDDTTWGGLALFRGGGSAFDADEVAFAASLSSALANGYRSGILVHLLAVAGGDDAAGPALVIIDERNDVTQVSVGAERRLAELGAVAPAAGGDLPVVLASLVAGSRRYAAGRTTTLPRTRIRTAEGHWLVLHASPLAGPGASGGDTVVTIEEARPPEIVPLVVAAFQLTDRERDVTQLVLQGIETKQIARQLHLSAYTVQDHLKSIFEKAGVHSRRELIGRVFFDQYAPRFGNHLAPTGWFGEEPVPAG